MITNQYLEYAVTPTKSTQAKTNSNPKGRYSRQEKRDRKEQKAQSDPKIPVPGDDASDSSSDEREQTLMIPKGDLTQKMSYEDMKTLVVRLSDELDQLRHQITSASSGTPSPAPANSSPPPPNKAPPPASPKGKGGKAAGAAASTKAPAPPSPNNQPKRGK